MTRAVLNLVVRLLVFCAMVYVVVVNVRHGGVGGWAIAAIALLVGILDFLRLIGGAQLVRERV